MRVRSIAIAIAISTAACSTTEDEPHGVGYNKGCYSNNCDHYCVTHDCSGTYAQDAAPPPPPFVPPQGCPKTRSDVSRTGLTANDVRALLPGLYLSCSHDQPIEITVTEDGRLVAHGESFFVGACGTAQCDAVWGPEVGTLQIWTEPTAFTFTGDAASAGAFSDSYVRSPD